jgi:hypothetical protein
MIALGVGYLCQLGQETAQSTFLNDFLKNNLINLLIALLAINSATLGIVLTKMRELIDKFGDENSFARTKSEMMLSVKEQFGLIILAIITQTALSSAYTLNHQQLRDCLMVIVCGIFVYSLMNLYDTAKSVLIVIDYKA